jgi:hypothetical protein
MSAVASFLGNSEQGRQKVQAFMFKKASVQKSRNSEKYQQIKEVFTQQQCIQVYQQVSNQPKYLNHVFPNQICRSIDLSR